MNINYTINNNRIVASLIEKLRNCKHDNFQITQSNYDVGKSVSVFQITIIRQLHELTIPEDVDDPMKKKVYDDLLIGSNVEKSLISLMGYLRVSEETISISYSFEENQHTDSLIALLSEYIMELFQFLLERLIDPKEIKLRIE